MRRILVSLIITITLSALLGAGTAPLAAEGGQRNLVVFFEFIDNTSGVEQAVDYIFNQMLGPNDQLIIQSPARLYGFSRATLSKPKAELAAMMRDKLRGDIAKAAQDYKQVIKELELATRNIEANSGNTSQDLGAGMSGGQPGTVDMRNLFMNYRQALANLNQLRKINDASLRQLAGAFRGQPGENHIVILFERESRPIPSREALNTLRQVPLFAFQANELFSTDNLKEPFDVEALTTFFQGIPLAQHFVYVNAKSAFLSGNQFENSGDIYGAFSKIAKATGGICETLSEPVAGLKAVMAHWQSAK